MTESYTNILWSCIFFVAVVYSKTEFGCRRHSSVESTAPFILPPRVQVLSTTSMLCSIYIWIVSFGKDKNKHKRRRDWPIFKDWITEKLLNRWLVQIYHLAFVLKWSIITVFKLAPNMNDSSSNLHGLDNSFTTSQVQPILSS